MFPLIVVLLIVTRWDPSIVAWKLLVMLAALLWNALCVNALIGNIRDVMASAMKTESLFARSALRIAPDNITAFAYILTGIAGYATLVFPTIPQEFGGGRKPQVSLWLSQPEARWREQLRLPVSSDGWSIGPVAMVLETDTFFMVSPGLDAKGRHLPAIGIDKKAVSAIQYTSTRGALPLPFPH
jgi:hypothetical protein